MTERAHASLTGGFDIEGLLQAVRHQKLTVVAFAGAVVVVAGVLTALTPRQYEGVALIRLLPRAGQELKGNEVVNHDDGGYMEARERARTQLQLIQSRGVREETLRRYAALGHTDLQPTEAGVEALAGALSARPREDTELVEVGVLHANPEAAAILANLVVEVYLTANLESRTDAARTSTVWIEGQRSTTQAELDAAVARVMDFKQQHDVVDIDEKVDGISARMTALQAAAGEATTQRVLLESRHQEHLRMVARGETDVLAGAFDDAGLQTMARERAMIVTEAADVLSRYGEAHPDHQRAVARIKRVDALIAEEVKRNVESERSEIETLKQQEARIAEELVSVKADLLAKQRLRAEYEGLKEAEDRARSLVRALGERGAEVDLQARTRLNDVRMVDPAVTPTRPAKPNWKLNLAVALALGLGGGVALALLRHNVNAVFLSPGDIARFLSTPLLGAIIRLPNGVGGDDAPLYPFDHPRSRLAEGFRGVRAILQVSEPKSSCRRLVVTSSLPEEGKSFCAVGLGVAFSQLGQRVLLVDCDLRLPRLHRVFGVEAAPGLTDGLEGDDDPARGVVRSRVPGLHLLCSGTRTDYPNELLASDAAQARFDALAAVYDVIIFDTPPAGLLSDALAVARGADGVVLVVRRDKAPRREVQRTLSQLEQAGVQVLGAVLNDLPLERSAAGYGSRYYDESARTGRSVPTS